MQQVYIDPDFKKLIPPLAAEERRQLEENIKAEGCRDALVIWMGTLLDGHNRLDICTANGLPYRTAEIDLPSREAAVAWIINNQLGRRNLTPEQISYLRGQRYNREKLAFGENQYTRVDQNDLPTADRLALEYKVSAPTIKRDADFAEAVDNIAESLGEDMRQKVLSRDAGFSKQDVLILAKLEPEQQGRSVELVTSGQAKSVVDARRLLKKKALQEAPVPEGKFRVIYADPPWHYGNSGAINDDNYGRAERHYPTMTIEELCSFRLRDMPVKELADDNAVLFLWVTSPLLEECFPVIKAWGFQYKSSFVWDKVKHNFGHYNSVRHECLLVCTRGSCLPESRELHDSVVELERSDVHSEKPAYFREMIERMYPSGKKLELFARGEYLGWTCYGNQLATVF